MATHSILKLSIFLNIAIITNLSHAANIFEITATTEGMTQKRSYNTAEDAVNAIKGESLKNLFPSYTDMSAATGLINFRGERIEFNYDANSSTLHMNIPSLNVSRTFTGVDRNATQTLFKEWLKKDGQETLNKFQALLAKSSSVDPNANNVMNIAESNFNQAFSEGSKINKTISSGYSGVKTLDNLVGVGIYASSLKDNQGVKRNSYSLPLSYSFDLGQAGSTNQSRRLTFNLPITYSTIGEAKSANAVASVSLKLPIKENWSLTPAINWTLTGSKDLGAVGQAVGGSLSSLYTFKLNSSYDLSMGNMIGYAQSINFSFQGYSINPGLKNTIYRNGLLLSLPTTLLGSNIRIEPYVVDTRFTGSELFTKSFQEFGLDLADVSILGMGKFRVGAKYIHSNNQTGFMANFAAWF